VKGRLIEQYDLTLGKREMERLMTGLRVYCRDYEVTEADELLLAALEDVFQGDAGGRVIDLRALTDVPVDEPPAATAAA